MMSWVKKFLFFFPDYRGVIKNGRCYGLNVCVIPNFIC